VRTFHILRKISFDLRFSRPWLSLASWVSLHPRIMFRKGHSTRERYFIGGGFSNTDGGMILLEAADVEEAHKIARNDLLIERGIYRYDLFEWDLVVLSKDIND
jgi:hypothetical protein